jgi:serine phosphatase RsbU (regulator of sigma subunit)
MRRGLQDFVNVDTRDLLAIYSDGITEAENPNGRPFDEAGLADDLTQLLLRRCTVPVPAGV